jgi:thiamine kinase-like enzyme
MRPAFLLSRSTVLLLVPQLPAETPAGLPRAVADVFRAHPGLREVCGNPLEAVAEEGLSNRVFRLRAERGIFYLRLPHPGNPARIDRAAEAHNLGLAADLGLALTALYCDPGSGILATRAVPAETPTSADMPERLGAALGRLHVSGAAFRGRLDPGETLDALSAKLPRGEGLRQELTQLEHALAGLADLPGAREQSPLVPSHGDPSPGNCLLSGESFWLIDWEYSAMAEPAWDLAYAVLEHALTPGQERGLLASYRAAGAAHLCPAPETLALMKARCDAVSAFWAYSQVAAGRDREVYLPFARARRDRVLKRVERLTG